MLIELFLELHKPVVMLVSKEDLRFLSNGIIRCDRAEHFI